MGISCDVLWDNVNGVARVIGRINPTLGPHTLHLNRVCGGEIFRMNMNLGGHDDVCSSCYGKRTLAGIACGRAALIYILRRAYTANQWKMARLSRKAGITRPHDLRGPV
jgi:hypothetical protein